MKRILYVAALLCAFDFAAFGQGSAPLKVQEVDGSPSKSGITRIIVSNGTLTISGTTATITTGGGSGTPGGNDTELQYNNAGSFGGITGATTNGTFVTLTTPVLGVASATSVTASAAGLAFSGTNTTDNASVQAILLQGDRATVAGNDEAYATLRMSNAAGTQTEVARITWAIPTATAASEAGRIDFSVMTGGALAKELQLAGADLSPSSNDGLALGNSGSLEWSDLFLASGSVIGFNGGDVTITHSANLLTIAGGNVIISSPGSAGGSVATIDGSQTFTNKTITASSNVLGGVTMTLGSDADGDIYYRSSNVLTRLPKGTALQQLRMNAGATAPEWATISGGGLTVGTTTITSGTDTRVLYNNAGTLGEYAVTGSTNVVMSASPTLTGTVTAATISLASLISTAVSPAQITTSVNDYAGATGFYNRLDSDANDNIVSGMVAGTAGQLAYDINVGSFDLVYTHQSGNSSAANRFDNPGDMALTLHPGDTVARVYDGTTQRWRLLSNPYVFAPNVTTGSGTTGSSHDSAGVIFKANSLTSGDAVAMSSSSITSGNVLKIEATGTSAASNTKTALNVATSGANSSSGQQTYAAQFSNTSTGTSSQNYGVKVTVSGASTANIPLILSNGTSGDLIQLGGSGLTPYLGTGSGGPYFAGNAAGVTAILSMTYRAASTPLVILPSGGSLQWASGTAYTENGDTGMQRAAAGVIRINDGSTSSAPKTTAGSLIIGTSTGAIGSSGAGVLAFALSTAPSSSPADTVQMYSGDSAAGDHNLYTRNEGGEINRLTGLAARVSTQFDKTSDTALANVTGLTRNVEAGRTYAFTAVLYTTSNTSGGVKAAIGGTATATSIIYEAQTVDGSTVATVGTARATALGTTVGDVTAVAAARVTITGTIVVNAAGTLTVQFAQNASNGTASSVLVNSSFNLIPIG